jgi:hypothetical protein
MLEILFYCEAYLATRLHDGREEPPSEEPRTGESWALGA